MRCNQCGNEISNNSPFCPYCGAAQTPPVEEIPVEETPAAQETAPVQEAAPVGKKKKPVLRWAIIVATVAAVATLAVIFGNNIINSLMPADKRLQDTYVSLVEDAVKDLNFDGLQDAMESIGNAGSLGYAGAMTDLNATLSSDMELELSPNLITLLGGVNDPGIHKVTVNSETIVDGGKLGMGMTISANDTEIGQIILYMDMVSQRVVLEAPGLISMPVEMSLATYDTYGPAYDDDYSYGYGSADASVNSVMEILSAMDWSFLSEDAVKALLPRLVEVALADLEVEKENDTLSAAGVEQKATCLTVEFSEKTIQKMIVAVLKELKENEDAKTLLKDFYNKNADVFDLDYYGSANDFYKSFKELLNMALSTVKEEDASRETAITLSTWVNSDNKILALEVEADDTKIFIGTAKKGKDTGFELSAKNAEGETGSFELSGKTEKDIYNGKLVVKSNGEEVLVLDCEDMDLARCKEGDLNGTFTLKPGEAILAAQETPMDFAFVLKLDGSKVELDVRVNGASMATLKTNVSMEEGGTVTIPGNTIDYNSIAGYEQYYLDLDPLIQRLEKAGLHPDLVQMMRESFQ